MTRGPDPTCPLQWFQPTGWDQTCAHACAVAPDGVFELDQFIFVLSLRMRPETQTCCVFIHTIKQFGSEPVPFQWSKGTILLF